MQHARLNTNGDNDCSAERKHGLFVGLPVCTLRNLQRERPQKDSKEN
jgi:hypothetical protein